MDYYCDFVDAHWGCDLYDFSGCEVEEAEEWKKAMAAHVGAYVDEDVYGDEYSKEVVAAAGAYSEVLIDESIDLVASGELQVPFVRDYTAWQEVFEKQVVGVSRCEPMTPCSKLAVASGKLSAVQTGSPHHGDDSRHMVFDKYDEFFSNLRVNLTEVVYALTFSCLGTGSDSIYLYLDAPSRVAELKAIFAPYPWFVWGARSGVRVVYVQLGSKDNVATHARSLVFCIENVNVSRVDVLGAGMTYNVLGSTGGLDGGRLLHWPCLKNELNDFVYRKFPTVPLIDSSVGTGGTLRLLVSMSCVGVNPRVRRVLFDLGLSCDVVPVVLDPYGTGTRGYNRSTYLQVDDDPCQWAISECGSGGRLRITGGGRVYGVDVKLTDWRPGEWVAYGFGILNVRLGTIRDAWFVACGGVLFDQPLLWTNEHRTLDKYGCFTHGADVTSGQFCCLPDDRLFYQCVGGGGVTRSAAPYISPNGVGVNHDTCYCADASCGVRGPSCFDADVFAGFKALLTKSN